MIVVIVERTWDDRTGESITVVSHGYNTETDEVIPMSQDRVYQIGAPIPSLPAAIWDVDLQEYVLEQ